MNSDSIKYIIKVFLLIIAISFFTDKIIFFALNVISDDVKSGQSIGKLNQYLEKKDALDFIVFGSSRANHNINPIKISDNSFNMGVDGRMLAYSATLIKLLPSKKKQTIILHIDPENAFDEDYKGKDILALSTKYNRNDLIKNEIDKLNQENLLQNFYWSLSYNRNALGIIKNYFKPKYNHSNYTGFDPIYVTDVQREIFENLLKKEQVAICQEKLIINKLYSDYINDVNRFCIENNKELIVFTSPTYNDKCKEDNYEFNKIMKNKEITYFDLTDFFNDNNLIEYWKDETHLSEKGAEIFTQEIRMLLSRK